MKLLTKISLLLLTLPSIAGAMDLGVQGNIWTIAEPDIRKTIIKEVMKVDWEQKNKELTDQSKKFLSELPKRSFSYPERKLTNLIDVSVKLSQDIKVPVKNSQGGYSWNYLARKGDTVNPLANQRLGMLLFFFNGADERQVKLLENLLKIEPLLVMPIEAGAGDLNVTSKGFNRPIFYAPDYMINQFKINYLPTIAFQGLGEQSTLIKTISFPEGVVATDLLKDWDSWPKRDDYISSLKKNELTNKGAQ